MVTFTVSLDLFTNLGYEVIEDLDCTAAGISGRCLDHECRCKRICISTCSDETDLLDRFVRQNRH